MALLTELSHRHPLASAHREDACKVQPLTLALSPSASAGELRRNESDGERKSRQTTEATVFGEVELLKQFGALSRGLAPG